MKSKADVGLGCGMGTTWGLEFGRRGLKLPGGPHIVSVALCDSCMLSDPHHPWNRASYQLGLLGGFNDITWILDIFQALSMKHLPLGRRSETWLFLLNFVD